MIDVNLSQKAKLALKHPQTALQTLSDPLIFKNKATPFPRLINCFITEKCNFACEMCHVDTSRKARLTQINFPVLKRIIDESASYQPSFQIAGGEPLLYPDIIKILRYLTRKNIPTGMVTNGLLLEEFAQDIVDSGLEFLAISLDGPDRETQKKRGRVDSFDKVVAGIKKIVRIRGKRLFPNIRIATVITHNNLHNFDQILKLAEKLGVDQWSVSQYFYFPDSVYQSQQKFAQKNQMGGEMWGKNIGGEKDFFNTKERLLLKKKIGAISRIKKNKQSPVRITVDDNLDIEKYYTSCQPSKKSFCDSPYRQIFVRGNGDLEICQGYIIGNINKDSIHNSWNGSKARHFRNVFARCPLMPACFRCCSLDIKFSKEKND